MIVRRVALTAWIIAAGCGTPTDDRRSDTTTRAATLGSAPIDWREGATCYEIFVRSYYDSNGDGIGDLKGLTQKLDYINDGNPATERDLGAKCIWLMPVAESPSYHGYDASDYYRVDPDYGTNADFKAFAAAAHQRGIAVIVDMVLNHLSNEHPYFQDALGSVNGAHRAWFRFASPKPSETGPWGQEAWHKSVLRDEYYYGVFWHGMPDLNYDTPAVRQEAKRIASFWLTEMGVDGFRLDAVPYLIEEGRNQIGTAGTHAFLREYAAHIRSIAPNAFTVGEVWDGIDKMLPYYPDQLESYFAFDLSDSLVAAVRTGSAGPLMRRFARFQREVPNGRYSTFVRNHDQTRTVTALTPGAASMTEAIGRAKVAATLLLTLPGMPFVYYGEEIGMTGDKPDELLRTPMQWSASANAGFTTARPWQALAANWQTTNVTAQETEPASLLALHRKLINLRARTSALASGDFVPLTTSSAAVAAYLRRDGDSVVLVVVNLGGSAATSITLAAADGVLAAGTYRVTSLIGGPVGAPLTVASDGRVRDYIPLGSLGAREGHVFALTR